MTTRNLDALFEPKSIALIGASNQPRSVGAVTARNLFEAGFAGPIMTVNPHKQAIRSTINYHSVEELPLAPDLAVIATPPPTVPEIVASLGARGTRAVIVVTAGFGEGGSAEGAELRRRTLEAAKPHLVRILGPNCLGFISPARGINASFAHLTPLTGGLAFISQSGALVTAAIDWATARGFGFSHVISIGDMIDVDFGDLLDYLALDQLTHAILLYVESIVEAKKFMSAGRIAARNKPVLVLKSGRSSAGAKAAMSHTGALAGADLVYDAAFRRAGMLRVKVLDKVNGRAPQARLAGFSVEEMISRPQAFELLAGIADDPVFGPVILFGQGGTAAEIIRDRAIGLPPLNLPLAREMIGRTRVASLLEGYRDRPAAAIDEVALTLVKLSQLLIDVPEITELDINPLIADSEGVLALDPA